MDQQPPQTNTKKLLIVVVVSIAVMSVLSVLCCGGLAYFGINFLQDAEKVYYADCDDVDNGNACHDCCLYHGHNGHAFGEFFNDEGKTCGCLGASKPLE